jgi:4-carboxymuconolactone decarboxylase
MKLRASVLAAMMVSAPIEAALAQERMPEIPTAKMTAAQKRAVELFKADRGTAVFGPFIPLLRNPNVMLHAQALADDLRFNSVLPPKLNEFVILITARQWTQEYVWDVHYPIAIKAGLNAEIAKAVAEGRHPQGLSDEEDLVYDFCTELHRNKSVSDPTYARALRRFGEHGIIDMTSVSGYYTFLAMIMNMARTPPPKGSPQALKPFP